MLARRTVGTARHPAVGVSLVSLAAVLWATVGVASGMTQGIAAVDPAVAGLIRTTLGAGFLLGSARFIRVRDGTTRLPFRALALFGVAGAIFQVSLFQAFASVGVTATVAITVCAPPVIVAFGDALWRRRWPERGVLGAIVVAAAGVLLLLVRAPEALPGTVVYHAMPVAIASFAFATVAVAARTIGRSVHPMRGAGMGLASTAAVLACIVALSGGRGLASLGELGGRDLAILTYVGVVATGGAYLAFVLGMGLCSTAGAGMAATMIEPVVAAALATALLGEHLGPPEAAGCLLTLVALIILFRCQNRESAPSP